MRTPRIITALGFAAALSLTACSASVSTGPTELDVTKLETTIATGMQEQLELSAEPTVTCPDTISIQKDAVTTCTAELDGETVDVQVTQTDDQGNVNWEVVQPSS